MQTVGEHPVASGPLAVRWLAYELPPLRAGALARVRVVAENAGSQPWRDAKASYHWLDELGNPIVWDGIRTALDRPLGPGERVELDVSVRAPIPPGRYRLAFDLVEEYRAWYGELGNAPLEVGVGVEPRIERRALAVRGADPGVLDAQEEPVVAEEDAVAIAYLAPGCVPASDWSRRVLDAHEEGYAVVGGSVAVDGGLLRRAPRELEAYAPGSGRNPAFAHPLVCPSIVREAEPRWRDPVAGLPAVERPDDEPWLYDGRITLRARL